MKIVFTGDLFLGGDLQNANIEQIVRNCNFNEANKRVVNLEQAISEKPYVASKATLFTGYGALEYLNLLKIDVVNLAHNHIQDKGEEGIVETRHVLIERGVQVFGAGKTLHEARKPVKIAPALWILGYCEYGQPYLNQVKIAGENNPGVAPLDETTIFADLEKIPEGEQAILFFHWGREHVSLPPQKNIQLAKKLLKHSKVFAIIGMHPHRIQGKITYNGKEAFFSLGNFLFPNFYILPPVQMSTQKPKKVYNVTRLYHRVFQPTYKKWKKVNRTSLLLELDVETKRFSLIPVRQHDKIPVVETLTGLSKILVILKVFVLGKIYNFPSVLYLVLEKINTFVVQKRWRFGVILFYVKQLGFFGIYKHIKNE